MQFEWDEPKRAANLAKHAVDFSAIDGFDWETMVVRSDQRAGYGESRWAALGMIEGRLHALVFVLRGQAVRIVSLRRASQKERAGYAKAKG